MDPRVLILAVPSLVVLGLLIAHSWLTLPRGRAIAFWCGVVGYGVLRGVALRWVIDHGSGGAFPYAIRNPLLSIFGVPLQEVIGWAIVVYLGWWLGCRFSRYVFAQVAWACLFLGSISWAVESAAVAVGWWRWAVPVTQPLFVNVPFIAIVDWLFVGIDFLLPFLAVTAPASIHRRWRFAWLLAFPVHFGSHCFAASDLAGIPIHHLVHWILIAALVWLALRGAAIDEPFAGSGSWLPIAGLALILAVAAAVELVLARRPGLLPSIAPALAMATQTLSPTIGYVTGALALALGLLLPACFVAAIPAAASAVLTWGRKRRRWASIVAVALLAVAAYEVHSVGARAEDALKRRLDIALAARDRGDLDAATRELAALASDFPGSHVPLVLLGEIDYRTDRLAAARRSFLRAAEIKQDDARSYRYLAVIERRLGRMESSARFAGLGLTSASADPELLYLSGRAAEPQDAATTLAVASLAYEVGDTLTAETMLDRGLSSWPGERALYPSRAKLALQRGDAATARRVVIAWRERFPQDAEARQLSRVLGVN